MATTFNKQLVVLATGSVIFLTLLTMPTFAGLTPEGQRMLAVTALMAIWWIGEGTPLADCTSSSGFISIAGHPAQQTGGDELCKPSNIFIFWRIHDCTCHGEMEFS